MRRTEDVSCKFDEIRHEHGGQDNATAARAKSRCAGRDHVNYLPDDCPSSARAGRNKNDRLCREARFENAPAPRPDALRGDLRNRFSRIPPLKPEVAVFIWLAPFI